MPSRTGSGAGAPLPFGLTIRPARADDLPGCAEVWRASLSEYGIHVGRPPLPPTFGPLLDLLSHLRATDPDRFVVAVRERRTGESISAFGSAARRGQVWYLSMLFVLPDAQGVGVGRRILEAILPDARDGLVLATCTDSAQPISNALYSRYGIVPRQPVIELVGTPDLASLPALPDGVRAVAIGVPGPSASPGPAATEVRPSPVLDSIDRATLGYAHPEDHAYLTRSGRLGFLFEGPDGAPLGYGYAAVSGRVGPVAVLDPALMAGALGHLLRCVEPVGAFSAWVPGAAGGAIQTLLRAGLRIEDFPALLCWDRPFADFERYIPITLAVL